MTIASPPSSCSYCYQRSPHPLFCYLLSDRRFTSDFSRHSALPYIGVSRHPLLRLQSHNRVSGFRSGQKCTKPCASFWQLELVIGPFYQSAVAFKKEWRKSSRKIMSRIRQGVALAKQYRVANVYARDTRSTISICQRKRSVHK
jgi:hypothetical protein